MPTEWTAPKGAEWCCWACGKHGKERDRIGDAACFLNAVLVVEGSVRVGADGKKHATAWEDRDHAK